VLIFAAPALPGWDTRLLALGKIGFAYYFQSNGISGYSDFLKFFISGLKIKRNMTRLSPAGSSIVV